MEIRADLNAGNRVQLFLLIPVQYLYGCKEKQGFHAHHSCRRGSKRCVKLDYGSFVGRNWRGNRNISELFAGVYSACNHHKAIYSF